MPTKNTVPLKVWVVASASCFAVCAVLVLATVVVTKWGTAHYSTEYVAHSLDHTSHKPMQYTKPEPRTEAQTITEENDMQFPILEKLFYKNMVSNRQKKQDLGLISKQQLHPLHDDIHHPERRIEKKDQAKYAEPIEESNTIPVFKPTLPDIFGNDVKLPEEFIRKVGKQEMDQFEDYYNDENLYDDYMQSNTMTSYLLEKVQELHDWISSDPELEGRTNKTSNGFGQVLKALNESLVEGNVTIIMNKLKDIYFGDNYTHVNHSRRVILSNSTDLLSFGILTLDVILLHNIQMMAWENQEAARVKMLKDPDVFAFNALFLDPLKVEAKKNEVFHAHDNFIGYAKRQRQETIEEFDFGKNLLENVLEIGMSTARAAIHLGRAYKNTKIVLNQLSNKEAINSHIQSQFARNIDGNTHALSHLQTSFHTDSSSVASNNTVYTELDCVWMLYCKNLLVTSKLNAPYGTMARINGLALRMLTGELSADKALDTMLYEALTGWTELRCSDMFPRCSKVNAANIVMDSIMSPLKKTSKAR